MTDPLLLVGHGTRDRTGIEAFTRFADRLSATMPVDVAGAFIELSPPPLTDAVSALYAAGHRRMVAVPLVLVSAGHAKGDIPGALARERARHQDLGFAYGRPLGPHPRLLGLLTERIGPLDDDTAVLLVGRGSTDPDANAEVCKVARLLWETTGCAMVETAFVSLARPEVPEGLARCRKLGARRIVVAPYFLFPGVLPSRVAAQATAYAAQHPRLDVRCAEVIGDCDGLADVVVERYDEAVAGDLRMNCDTCVYRVAMPGFEHRVGAPQRPHHHPDDPAHTH